MKMPMLIGPAMAMLFLAACDDNDYPIETGPPPSQVVGTWEATKVEFAGQFQQVDLVSLGGTLTLEFRADSTCRLTTTFPGEATEVMNGTWHAIPGFSIQYSGPGYAIAWDFDVFTVSETTLTLSGAWADYDFDGDGEYEFAFLNLVLVRQ